MRITKEQHVKRMGERAAWRQKASDARELTLIEHRELRRVMEARRENGVGRPPIKAGEEWSSWSRGAQADQVNGMADSVSPVLRRNCRRRAIFVAPGPIGTFAMAYSTTALRKSKRRKGRA